ncbi:unnamed protein product [Paramecium sonneborni]|uniref:Uncharacterized protein n=1 Tax=Paramecium sonneborni TaxID=65129 RepID=A0A8S1RV76_9CILI|nr:unnamed protein product [Paramecium sonneborni]
MIPFQNDPDRGISYRRSIKFKHWNQIYRVSQPLLYIYFFQQNEMLKVNKINQFISNILVQKDYFPICFNQIIKFNPFIRNFFATQKCQELIKKKQHINYQQQSLVKGSAIHLAQYAKQIDLDNYSEKKISSPISYFISCYMRIKCQSFKYSFRRLQIKIQRQFDSANYM